MGRTPGCVQLFTQLQAFGDGLITGLVGSVKVIQQPPPLAHHHEQAAPGADILMILLQMLGNLSDPLRQKGDLHIGRTGITLVPTESGNAFLF